jgi:hypothetical protein
MPEVARRFCAIEPVSVARIKGGEQGFLRVNDAIGFGREKLDIPVAVYQSEETSVYVIVGDMWICFSYTDFMRLQEGGSP